MNNPTTVQSSGILTDVQHYTTAQSSGILINVQHYTTVQPAMTCATTDMSGFTGQHNSTEHYGSKNYLVIMMDEPATKYQKTFDEQFNNALKGTIAAKIQYEDTMTKEELQHMLESVIGTKTDITPLLLYADYGWGEIGTRPDDLVFAASIASLVTGNITGLASYEQGYGQNHQIIYNFEI